MEESGIGPPLYDMVNADLSFPVAADQSDGYFFDRIVMKQTNPAKIMMAPSAA